MWQRGQFSILSLLVAMALIALFFAQNEWIVLFAIQALAVLLFVTIITNRLPTTIKNAMHANCVRWDGSWSERRERIENRSVSRLRKSLLGAALLVLIPTNALFLLANDQWFPFSIGVDALAEFRPNVEEWKPRLKDTERDFDQWGKQHHLTTQATESRKRLLWNSWPLIIVLALVWVGGCFWFIQHCYMMALLEHAESIRYRAERYEMRDLMGSA